MSGARSRNKGARAERAVVCHLRCHGYPDARRYMAADGRAPGDIDLGDNAPPVVFEVKAHNTYDFPSWIRQAQEEAGDRLPVVVAKPRGQTDVGKWWALLTFDDLLGLLEDR